MTDPVTDTAMLKLLAQQALENGPAKMERKKIHRDDLHVGMLLFRSIRDRATGKVKKVKIRVVLELWDGAEVKAELARWHIYLGWTGTSDWNRVRYYEVASGKSQPKTDRCTQVGLARWAEGIIVPEEP